MYVTLLFITNRLKKIKKINKCDVSDLGGIWVCKVRTHTSNNVSPNMTMWYCADVRSVCGISQESDNTVVKCCPPLSHDY